MDFGSNLSHCCFGMCTKHEHPKTFGGPGNKFIFGHNISIEGILLIKKAAVNTPSD